MSKWLYEYQCCGKICTLLDDVPFTIYLDRHNFSEYPYKICSVSCLCDWAWRVRENQFKLSKSKVENGTNSEAGTE